jgi:hypothetical protein
MGRGGVAVLITWVLLALVSAPAPARGAQAGGEAGPPRPLPAPPVAVPVADPIYDDLRALAARRVMTIPGLTARPRPSFTLAPLLPSALARAETLATGEPRLPALARVVAELADPLHATGIDSAARPRPVLLQFGDSEAGESGSRFQVSAFARFQAEASPGRGFVLTDSTRTGLRFSWIVWPNLHLFEEIYVANVEGGHEFADPLVADSDIIIFQDRVYAGLHTRYVDIILGRDRLAWGPGGNGTLLLSETSRPFTHLRLEGDFMNGRIHGVVVNGVLSQAERRYVAFHRLEWQVSRRLRVAAAEGARYNADSFEPLYLVGIIPYPLVGRLLERDNASRDSDELVRNNVTWDLDASYFLDQGIELYGEILIDDIGTGASENPTRIAYQLGGLLTRDLHGYPFTLRGEWTRVWRYVYTVFYDADFVHEGIPLGYPQGPDSRVVRLAGAVEARPGLELGALGERIDRGEDGLGVFWDPDDPALAGVDASDFGGTVERQWRLLGTLRWRPSTVPFEALLELGGAWVQNTGHQVGEETSGLTGKIALAIER